MLLSTTHQHWGCTQRQALSRCVNLGSVSAIGGDDGCPVTRAALMVECRCCPVCCRMGLLSTTMDPTGMPTSSSWTYRSRQQCTHSLVAGNSLAAVVTAVQALSLWFDDAADRVLIGCPALMTADAKLHLRAELAAAVKAFKHQVSFHTKPQVCVHFVSEFLPDEDLRKDSSRDGSR